MGQSQKNEGQTSSKPKGQESDGQLGYFEYFNRNAECCRTFFLFVFAFFSFFLL